MTEKEFNLQTKRNELYNYLRDKLMLNSSRANRILDMVEDYEKEFIKRLKEKEVLNGCGREFKRTWQLSVPKANLFICGEGILCDKCSKRLEEIDKLAGDKSP